MIEKVVGKKVYSVWIDMLSRLVPHGRTHRLSVLIASILQCAQEIAYDKSNTNENANKLNDIFETAYEDYVEGDTDSMLQLAESLLLDAKVKFRRINSRGSGYSIAENAVHEYLHWEDMPWES